MEYWTHKGGWIGFPLTTKGGNTSGFSSLSVELNGHQWLSKSSPPMPQVEPPPLRLVLYESAVLWLSNQFQTQGYSRMSQHTLPVKKQSKVVNIFAEMTSKRNDTSNVSSISICFRLNSASSMSILNHPRGIGSTPSWGRNISGALILSISSITGEIDIISAICSEVTIIGPFA